MTADQHKFFYEFCTNRWAEESIEALVAEETDALYQDMLNEVEKQHFHEAALIRGEISAWEKLAKAIRDRADKYQPPRVEAAP